MRSLIVLGFIILSSAAYAQHSDEQARLCTGDAMRLCGAYIPDVDRITVCMRLQRENLSAPCKSVFEPAIQPASSRK